MINNNLIGIIIKFINVIILLHKSIIQKYSNHSLLKIQSLSYQKHNTINILSLILILINKNSLNITILKEKVKKYIFINTIAKFVNYFYSNPNQNQYKKSLIKYQHLFTIKIQNKQSNQINITLYISKIIIMNKITKNIKDVSKRMMIFMLNNNQVYYKNNKQNNSNKINFKFQ